MLRSFDFLSHEGPEHDQVGRVYALLVTLKITASDMPMPLLSSSPLNRFPARRHVFLHAGPDGDPHPRCHHQSRTIFCLTPRVQPAS